MVRGLGRAGAIVGQRSRQLPWPLRLMSPGSARLPGTTWAPLDSATSAARALPQDSPRAGAAPRGQGRHNQPRPAPPSRTEPQCSRGSTDPRIFPPTCPHGR